MDDRQRAVLWEYARDVVNILARNVSLYREGARECYRVVAVQLRILLCDTTRLHGKIADISLAARLWPDLFLHPLVQDAPGLHFDRTGQPLSRQDWLRQTLLLPGGEPLTLRDAIRLVCDRDGGAHVDPPVEAPLPDLAQAIVDVGDYIVGEIGNKAIRE